MARWLGRSRALRRPERAANRDDAYRWFERIQSGQWCDAVVLPPAADIASAFVL